MLVEKRGFQTTSRDTIIPSTGYKRANAYMKGDLWTHTEHRLQMSKRVYERRIVSTNQLVVVVDARDSPTLCTHTVTAAGSVEKNKSNVYTCDTFSCVKPSDPFRSSHIYGRSVAWPRSLARKGRGRKQGRKDYKKKETRIL